VPDLIRVVELIKDLDHSAVLRRRRDSGRDEAVPGWAGSFERALRRRLGEG
jgi:hypothetical protein